MLPTLMVSASADCLPRLHSCIEFSLQFFQVPVPVGNADRPAVRAARLSQAQQRQLPQLQFRPADWLEFIQLFHMLFS